MAIAARKITELNGPFSSKPCLMKPEGTGRKSLSKTGHFTCDRMGYISNTYIGLSPAISGRKPLMIFHGTTSDASTSENSAVR